MVDVVQNQVRAIKKTMSAIRDEIRSATIDVADVLANIDDREQAALAKFNEFDRIYKQADAVALRGFLIDTVDYIKINVSRSNASGRYRYKFDGGELFLRPDAELFDSW